MQFIALHSDLFCGFQRCYHNTVVPAMTFSLVIMMMTLKIYLAMSIFSQTALMQAFLLGFEPPHGSNAYLVFGPNA